MIWFIRHGESESNANLQTTHPAESALTSKGRAESQAIVHSFDTEPSLIVVSPYLRARQTAEPTIAHFQPVLVEEWPVYEWTYLDPTRYRNTNNEQRRPFSLAYWDENDPLLKDGGVGESFAELMDRVERTVARLRGHSAAFIAMFSHGLFLRALIWSVMSGKTEATPESMAAFRYFLYSLWLPNAAILKASVKNGGDLYLTGFDISHLAQE